MSEERCYPRLSEWMTNYTHHANYKCVVERVYYVKGPQEKDPEDLIVYKHENGRYYSVTRASADGWWVKDNPLWEKDVAYERPGWKTVVVKHVFADGTAAVEELECPSRHSIHVRSDRRYWTVAKAEEENPFEIV